MRWASSTTTTATSDSHFPSESKAQDRIESLGRCHHDLALRRKAVYVLAVQSIVAGGNADLGLCDAGTFESCGQDCRELVGFLLGERS